MAGEDIAAIGSYNFDLRSTYLNTELMLVIKSGELTKELKKNFEEIEKDSRKVIDETHYETPSHVKVAEVPGWKENRDENHRLIDDALPRSCLNIESNFQTHSTALHMA